jgi:hypothetical protein
MPLGDTNTILHIHYAGGVNKPPEGSQGRGEMAFASEFENLNFLLSALPRTL